MLIYYISNPSIEVQLESVKQNPNAIKYIPNPSIEVQLAAVKQNPKVKNDFSYSNCIIL
jgi:hypothetical protein